MWNIGDQVALYLQETSTTYRRRRPKSERKDLPFLILEIIHGIKNLFHDAALIRQLPSLCGSMLRNLVNHASRGALYLAPKEAPIPQSRCWKLNVIALFISRNTHRRWDVYYATQRIKIGQICRCYRAIFRLAGNFSSNRLPSSWVPRVVSVVYRIRLQNYEHMALETLLGEQTGRCWILEDDRCIKKGSTRGCLSNAFI